MNLQDIRSRYQESYDFLHARKRRQVQQLVLLSNLNRGEQNITSTLLLSLFNRVLSSHFQDKMGVKFLPSQDITQDQINTFNTLSQSDYQEMEKSRIDYDWAWDALFFGRGYCETIRFNQNRKIMEPAVINPLVFGYDPYFEDVQSWRYYWKWVNKTKWEIKKLIEAKVITGINKPEDIESGVDATLWDYKIKVDQARKGTTPGTDTQAGDVYQILEFFGYDEDGDKAVCWVDKSFTKILFEQKIDLEDGEEIVAPNGTTVQTGSRWPIIAKECFRQPHSSISFSVADLLDDKHRAKSVLLNLAFVAAKDRANPVYGYNPDKVKDVSQFFSRQINQHIPMEGPDAAWPLNKEDPMSAGLLQFISILTDEANSPLGTGFSLQPQKGMKKQTATESAINQQLNDMAKSLQSRVMQFGESEFWSHWFYRYRKYGKALGEKLANITGAKGIQSSVIDLKDFQTKYPPGVLVYSSSDAEYKELVLRRDLMNLYPQIAQSIGPDGMRNFNKHVFFPKFLQDPSLVDLMLPDTLDEIQAKEENEILKEDKYARVSEEEDHTNHLYIHQTVFPKTLALIFHMAEHRDFLAKSKQQQKQQQMQAPLGQQGDSSGGQGGGQDQIPKSKQKPQNTNQAASPLKDQLKTSNQSIKT